MVAMEVRVTSKPGTDVMGVTVLSSASEIGELDVAFASGEVRETSPLSFVCSLARLGAGDAFFGLESRFLFIGPFFFFLLPPFL